MIRPDLRSTVRVVAVVGFTLPALAWIALLGGCPISDWYARRMPPRSYKAVALGGRALDLCFEEFVDAIPSEIHR